MRASHASLRRVVGRYAIYGEIAAGGMGTVNYGRLQGPVGFSRTVAVKCMHPQFTKDPAFVAMFIDEARLAARIHHPNVVQTTDVVATEDDLVLVMEFVHGESLSRLLRAASERGVRLPLDVTSAIVCGLLHGLHAAHQAKNEAGELLGIVHRDVSPQNVLVGADGVARVLDFGIAKASGRVHTTKDGQVKGKLAYMAPEQLRAGEIDRRTDLFATGIVLWEALTGRRLFGGDSEGIVVTNVLERIVDPPSAAVPDLPKDLDAVVLRALSRDPANRFATAEEMALALESTVPVASNTRVARTVADLAGATLAKRAEAVAAIEASSGAAAKALESVPELEPSAVRIAEPTGASAAVDAPSQPSAMSVATPLDGARAPVARQGVWLGAVAGVVSAVVVVLIYAVTRAGAPATTGASVTAAVPPATATPTPTTSSNPAPTAAPTPNATATATEPVVGTTPTEPAASPSATPPKASPASKTPGSGSIGKPCPLKSYFDANGVKHYEHRCE